MIVKDYYKILQLNSNRVNTEQIKNQYKELAKKYHPDLNVGNPNAEERFKDISEAYRILTDVNSRKKYDKIWNANVGRKISYSNSDNENVEENNNTFFSILFGSTVDEHIKSKINKKNAVKGENIETEITVSIDDAFIGAEKKIVLKDVNGNDKIINVKIPEGIENGKKIKITGEGKKGKNGGKNGDLFITVNIKNDENFELVGQDIKTKLYLTPWEAALGSKVNVNGIREIETIYVPAGIQTKEQIVLKNKGYKDTKGQRGNLIIEAEIVVPKKLTNEEAELFQKLQKVSKFMPRTNIE